MFICVACVTHFMPQAAAVAKGSPKDSSGAPESSKITLDARKTQQLPPVPPRPNQTRLRAKWDFVGSQPGDLSFKKGTRCACSNGFVHELTTEQVTSSYSSQRSTTDGGRASCVKRWASFPLHTSSKWHHKKDEIFSVDCVIIYTRVNSVQAKCEPTLRQQAG